MSTPGCRTKGVGGKGSPVAADGWNNGRGEHHNCMAGAAVSRPIRPWSRDKLDLLGKYLQAYTRIMHRQPWLKRSSFIDAFAGAGQYFDPEVDEYVDGSPLVALDCEPPFDEFWFIDLSSARIAELHNHADTRGRSDIHFHTGDANRFLTRDVARTITYDSYRRGFVFVDPYGLQVDWATIEVLAATKALDLFINFPVMGVNRLLPRDEAPDPTSSERLKLLFKDTEWVESLYLHVADLFGDVRAMRDRLDAQRLADRYIADVRSLFPYTSRPVIMRNSVNAPLYALFLASHNANAARITDSIFDKYTREAAARPPRPRRNPNAGLL